MRRARFGVLSVAASAAALTLVISGGCRSQGRYTNEGASLAAEKMAGMKAGTEWDMARQAFLSGDIDKAERKIKMSLRLNDHVAKSHVLRGRIKLERSEIGDAMDSLRTAEALDPTNVEAQYYLGILFERIIDPANAEKHFMAACELDNFNPAYAIAAAEMMIDQGKLDEAKQFLEDGPMFEHSAGVRQALGHIALLNDDTDSAAEYFGQAHLLAPDDEGIAEDVIAVQMMRGQFAKAESNIAQIRRKPSFAARNDLKHMHAECLLATDRPVEARTLYLEITSTPEGAGDVDAWIGLGNAAYVLHDERGLKRAAARVVSLVPSRSDGYSLFALHYRRSGKTNDAITSIDRAIKVAAADASLHAFRGLVLADAGRETEATRAFAAAVRLSPSNKGYRVMLRQANQGTFATAPTED